MVAVRAAVRSVRGARRRKSRPEGRRGLSRSSTHISSQCFTPHHDIFSRFQRWPALAHARRVGDPRAMPDGLADPRRPLGLALRGSEAGVRRDGERHCPLRAPDVDRQPGPGRRCASARLGRRRDRRDPDRRLVGARLGPDRGRRCRRARAGVDFRFNSWGERFLPYDKDAASGEAILDALGIERIVSEMVLEGGSLTVDGEGTLITTEQCLLNENRNPGLTREAIESELKARLGVEKIDLAAARPCRGHAHRRPRRRGLHLRPAGRRRGADL